MGWVFNLVRSTLYKLLFRTWARLSAGMEFNPGSSVWPLQAELNVVSDM